MKRSIQERLMQLVAGRRVAYWISDHAQTGIDGLNSTLGAGGAICLVEAVKNTGATSATYTLDDATITVTITAREGE